MCLRAEESGLALKRKGSIDPHALRWGQKVVCVFRSKRGGHRKCLLKMTEIEASLEWTQEEVK